MHCGKRLTSKAYRMARKMKNGGKPMHEIVAAFNGIYTAADITAALQERREYIGGRALELSQELRVRTVEAPPEVIQRQQDRHLLRHTDITALICGDPLPGESALDRRQQQPA